MIYLHSALPLAMRRVTAKYTWDHTGTDPLCADPLCALGSSSKNCHC